MDEIAAFFESCFEDRLDDAASQLKQNSALIESRHIGGRTPLHQAAFGGSLRVAELLIASKADVNAVTEYGWVPLHYAAAPLSESVAELLIRNGALPNALTDDGSTPLHFAADFGEVAMARLLMSSGADVNVRNQDGQTALDFAEPDSELAAMLLAKGALSGNPIKIDPDATLPDWLQGHEGAITELLNTVEEQWNTPDRGHISDGGKSG